MDILFKIIGAFGLVIISWAVIIKKERRQDKFFILGGICLLAYSIYIREWIFILLQIVFISTAALELSKLKKAKHDQD